jgi:hypothetical protein
MSSALDQFASNFFLFCMWWIGEVLLVKFDGELGAEVGGGHEWQKSIDADLERKVNKGRGYMCM